MTNPTSTNAPTKVMGHKPCLPASGAGRVPVDTRVTCPHSDACSPAGGWRWPRSIAWHGVLPRWWMHRRSPGRFQQNHPQPCGRYVGHSHFGRLLAAAETAPSCRNGRRLAALPWLIVNTERMNIDPDRIAIAGDDAGVSAQFTRFAVSHADSPHPRPLPKLSSFRDDVLPAEKNATHVHAQASCNPRLESP